MSRAQNSLRNAGASFAGQLISALLRFACRTAFLHTLGAEYLGIPALYTNVITLLSVSELGFSTVITFHLYQPLAKGDRAMVRALMNFYRKVYRVVGLVVLLLGLCLMPALPRLMTGVTDQVNIYLYYLIYLAQTVVSYLFFAYKSVLLVADQKKYVVDLAFCLVQVLFCGLQIGALVLFHSFLVYTLLSVAATAVQNVAAAALTTRRYPWLRGEAAVLDAPAKRSLFKAAYAMFLQRISVVIGTATDNLIISAFISNLAVGLYSNYSMVVTTVQVVISNAVRALTASLGDLYAAGHRERSYRVFRTLQLVLCWLLTVCTTGFLVLFRPFIMLWAGEGYLLDDLTAAIIAFNFLTNFLQLVVLIYRDATGLFVVGKYRSVVNAVLNLGLSLLFVHPWGMAGVFLASIFSRLATNWWFDAYVLFRRGFEKSPAWYYAHCGLSAVAAALCAGAVNVLCTGLPEASWGYLLVRAALCVALPTTVYGVLFGRSEEAQELYKRVRTIVCRRNA